MQRDTNIMFTVSDKSFMTKSMAKSIANCMIKKKSSANNYTVLTGLCLTECLKTEIETHSRSLI